MPILAFAAVAAVLQQHPVNPTGNTSPANGDTVGYWQQRVAYTIVATLDERSAVVRARGTLRYVNNSPDTLREMYVHQYLNAFRPGSKWSEVDEREGRERFQHLEEPEFGFERFTSAPRVNGTAVTVDYPGAPDSTVAHFVLPRPLAPRDSILVDFAWHARPSTYPRRQARRGRHWDLAQWYPKVAVYDRAGWEHNALQPAGEFYGEYGTYDVTVLVANDQVVGGTGVPVAGDPGWSRVIRNGSARLAESAYQSVPAAPPTDVPAGYRAVRFFARDVHHFAWAASPDFRYEGGVYVRQTAGGAGPAWDTVSIHALYQPGDDTTWGGMKALRRTSIALRWLESIYGPYAYPQMTALHRIDGGGTEFPMMMMNGSASQGLILHEGGHVFTYGILGNNEWRSGWMDEGLTSYQTEWAQTFTPQERERGGGSDLFLPPVGYRARAPRLALPRFERTALLQTLTDLNDEAEPIGTKAQDFRDFDVYNNMIYTRAQVMYGQLRDAIGDSAFSAFLHDYYARWELKHVDERAMHASAERASGKDLGWFFDQWVHRTGLTDYALHDVRTTRAPGGQYVTEAVVRRRGQYDHPMMVGVRTASGWATSRASDANAKEQTVRIVTGEEPIEVRLDPFHFSWDWDRRNDTPGNHHALHRFDWPFLNQLDRERSVLAIGLMGWYSEPGGVTAGIRTRSSYLDVVDKVQFGLVSAVRPDLPAMSQLQGWLRIENPYFGFMKRPAMGRRVQLASLDDITLATIGQRGERQRGRRTRQDEFTLTYAHKNANRLLPELWFDDSTRATLDVSTRGRITNGDPDSYFFTSYSSVVGFAGACARCGFGKAELDGGRVQALDDGRSFLFRLYVGTSSPFSGDREPPSHRKLYLSSADPVETFDWHWWRPRGSALKQIGAGGLAAGGAGLRGYHWSLSSPFAVAANVQLSHSLADMQRDYGTFSIVLNVFGDAAIADTVQSKNHNRSMVALLDAGVGIGLKGQLFDRPISLRLDSPFFVNTPALAIDRGHAGGHQIAPRWVLSFRDIW